MINKILCIGTKNNIFNNSYQKNYSTPVFILKPMPFDTVSFKSKKKLEEKQALFDSYNPQVKDFGSYKIPVHNDKIAEKLQISYSSEEFDRLFNFAQDKGTFDIEVNQKTGFIKTSQIDSGENSLMADLVWVTDTCNFMPLLKDKNPELCVPLLENLSEFYAKQQKDFDKIISAPSLYQYNRDWANTANLGVGHVFSPSNLKPHKWFPRTRLDSMGLYLQTASDLILKGMDGADYGYKSSKEISDNTIKSIANCTAYFQKIFYPYAKSTGPWEEKTFNTTPSSDVAIINQAYRNVIELMYAPTDNKELKKVRSRIEKSRHGDVFYNKFELENLLKIGENRIIFNSKNEVPAERVHDGAMSFIFKTEHLDKHNPINDAKLIMKRLEKLEKKTRHSEEIVRDNGILRYIKDNYLHINQNLAGNDFNQEYFKKYPKKTEAQWFMVSDMSKSYGTVARNLIEFVNQNDEEFGSKEQIVKDIHNYDKNRKTALLLIDKAIAKETEFINRGYARLTGENSYKANGRKCPAFKVPEAYQAITDSTGKTKFVPGTHTPLTWAQVSLYDASKMMSENLKAYESLK